MVDHASPLEEEPSSPFMRAIVAALALVLFLWSVYGPVSMETTKEIEAREKLHAPRLPLGVKTLALHGDDPSFVRRQNALLPEPHVVALVELEGRRVPPYDAVVSGLGPM